MVEGTLAADRQQRSRSRLRLLARWSWRDLAKRWLLVAAIALIIALGTGAFAGLGGTSQWRRQSQQASYASLHAHDVSLTLASGSFLDAGRLRDAVAALDSSGQVLATQERLSVATQVDASTPTQTILVPGRLVGWEPATADSVDRLHLGQTDASVEPAGGADDAVLEEKFAAHYGLAPSGTVRVSGGREIAYRGLGYTPDFFLIRGQFAAVFGEANFAALFLPRERVEALTGLAGKVNELAIRLRPGSDRRAFAAALAAELPAALPDASATVTALDDDPVYRILFEDADNDQKTWNIFAVLVLVAASFASFNLISRIVESERREIGVGMALGAPPRQLALRPLLVGAQVALAGVLAGTGVGWLFAEGMKRLMRSVLPLPMWQTPFPTSRFAQAAVLGFVLPLAATVVPVVRAVRVEPVEAIRAGGAYGAAARTSRLGTVLTRLTVGGGRTTTRMPFRNVVRAPRRSLFTIAGIAIAITGLVTVLGAVDTWLSAIDRSGAELSRTSADRLIVDLDRITTADAPEVRELQTLPEVGASSTGLRLTATLLANGRSVDATPEVMDLADPMWSPTLLHAVGDLPTVRTGIVVSQKAADDLAVRPGETVTVRHPRRLAGGGYTLDDTVLTVTALQPSPLRWTAYVDRSLSGTLGAEGLVNFLAVRPGQGTTSDELRRVLFDHQSVGSVQPVSVMSKVVRDRIQSVIGVFQMLEVVVVAMAALIAFNSAAISVDERARDEATMFAFGLPVRTVLAIVTTESLVLGLAGTLGGIAGGRLLLAWMVRSLFNQTLPEIGLVASLSGTTLIATLALGIGAVTLAPLFMARRLRRMDIPATLRVLE